MAVNLPLLSLLTFLPLIGGLIIMFSDKENRAFHKNIATAFALFTFVLSLGLLTKFDASTHLPQFVERYQWISSFNIDYYMAVDGLSFPLVLLTTFLSLISVVASFGIEKRTKEYFFWFMMLETGMLGLFVALDFFLFYVFWEITLVPMYFLIGVWGGPKREYAAVKFFLFTLFGSVFMLLSMIALYFASGSGLPGNERTLDLIRLSELAHNGQLQLVGTAAMLVFLGLYLAFAIKVPAFPFHTWLPLAHVEAPTAVSVILAGVLLKMGTYGILRVCYPIMPEQTKLFLPILVVIACINIVYGAFCAMAQKDMKRMVAYSSVNHMGYCLLGMAAVMGNSNAAHAGLSGAVLQMVTHGIITGSLFLLVGVIYDRAHTREIDAFGGLATKMPIFAGFMIMQCMASLGLPGLAGFISEFLCFLGGFGGSFGGFNFKIWVSISVIGIVVTAAFFLRMLKLVLMGEFNAKWEGHMPDLTTRELVTIVPLAVFTLVLGIYPALVLRLMDTTLAQLIKLVAG
ncbi:MAG: NAD(P)H-quinone oxidoreductase chain 4 1 [Elusimicrobia bacterium]|nr:NAD(P)H-quinone oxidoreductase chain 4 1 [Elusimicrobiota bacterium]